MRFSRESTSTATTASGLPDTGKEGPPAPRRVVIFSANQPLYQALSSSLSSAAGVECTCRDCLPGGALPDAWAGRNSVLLFDCMSLDQESIARCLLSRNGGNNNHTDVVLFNVDKRGAFPGRDCDWTIKGIFFQDDSKSDFIEGMQTILKGRSWSPPTKNEPSGLEAHPRPCRTPEQQLASLSPREREILRLVSVGMANTEIAAELTISLNTVKTHIYNIYRKIGVSNRLQAAIWASAHDHPRD